MQLEHPETKLTEKTAQSIKKEIGQQALRDYKDRTTRCHLKCSAVVLYCHLKCRAVVLYCTNTLTKEWLEKQLIELNSFQGVKLRTSPSQSLVKRMKVSHLVPKSTEAEKKKDTMLDLQYQNRVKTNHWMVFRENSNSDGHSCSLILMRTLCKN